MDNRVINRGIRILPPREKGSKKLPKSITFSRGMEDQLAAALTQSQLDNLVENGSLEGRWISGIDAAKEAARDAKAALK